MLEKLVEFTWAINAEEEKKKKKDKCSLSHAEVVFAKPWAAFSSIAVGLCWLQGGNKAVSDPHHIPVFCHILSTRTHVLTI